MRQALAKKLFAGSIAALFALIGILPAATAYADTFPYLKVTSGDLSAGGWFGADCNKATNPNFQDAFYTGGGIADNSAGGIYTYARLSGNYQGSSSQYAAYAQGLVDNGSAPNGFFSGSVNGVSINNTLSFANVYNLGSPPAPGGYSSGIWGGSLHDVTQCIPDYYSVKQPTSTTALTAPLSGSPASGAYTADGTGANAFALNTSTLTIAAGANISIFVNGNVYIGANITYQGHNTTNIPRLAIIAKGDIFVSGTVTNLDGLYIAQPDSSKFNDATHAVVTDNTQGVFYSCHGQAAAQTIDSGFLIGNCQSPLTVNGAVIAKEVNLLRISGDISGAPAETFNYSSDMLLGGPFFPGSSSGGSTVTGTPEFARIISLPPVF